MDFKRAVELHSKNPAIFWALRWLRKKMSLRKTVEYVKNNMKDPMISSTNIQKWKNECPSLLTNNNLFREFMIAIWVDPDDIKKENEKSNHKKWEDKRRKTQKEKDHKLKDEMKKANIILHEMNNPNMSESEKWRLSDMGRRQVDKINKSIEQGWLPKTDWVVELYDINCKLLSSWKKIIFDKINTINPKHLSELKALSDILDTAFKQNRLIEWKSTDNISIWVHDIYDKIIQNSDKKKLIVNHESQW